MVNKKQALRIGTFLAVLMFLLIPLLSSPVAATFTFGLGNVWTNNTTTGPTAGGTILGGSPLDNGPTFNGRFQVNYNYFDTDSRPTNTGSRSRMVVTVNWVPGDGTPPPAFPTVFTQPWVNLPVGGAQMGTYTTLWINGYGGKGTVFTVTVDVTCQSLTPAASFTAWGTPVTVTVV